jgi:aldehyde:ferredoxin oxidoreductase
MVYGYNDKVLRVDLETQKTRVEKLDEGIAEKYIGARGFAAYYEWKELRGVDPMSKDNKLYFITGPLTGTPGSKITIATKSPATGGYGESNMGGNLGAALRFTGYDMIVFENESEKPVMLIIDEGEARIEDASKYWGMEAIEAEKALKKELGGQFQIACIGPAGENLVKFAMINHDIGREAGRCGVGMVMGKKKIKAVAIKGSPKYVNPYDEKGLRQTELDMIKAVKSTKDYMTWVKYGTPGVVEWVNQNACYPTKNFSTSYFEEWPNLFGPNWREKIVVRDKGCYKCVAPCGKYSKAVWNGKEFFVEGPEYETIALLGGNLGVGDINGVAYLNYVCDQLGLDTISAGAVASWTIEAYEKGLITKEELGQDIGWGQVDNIAKLLERIAKRDGIGNILAEGTKKAAQKFGGEDFAMNVKGLEISGYESRWAPSMLLAYMTADIGAHHNKAWAITYDIQTGRDSLEGKAEKTIELQHIRPLFDALGVCRLYWVELGLDLDWYTKLYNLTTGLNRTTDELLKISERNWNLTRMFWYSEVEGFGREWDYPPKRWRGNEPYPTGPGKGHTLKWEQIQELLDRYYELRGWDKNGKPTPEKLKELELDFLMNI